MGKLHKHVPHVRLGFTTFRLWDWDTAYCTNKALSSRIRFVITRSAHSSSQQNNYRTNLKTYKVKLSGMLIMAASDSMCFVFLQTCWRQVDRLWHSAELHLIKDPGSRAWWSRYGSSQGQPAQQRWEGATVTDVIKSVSVTQNITLWTNKHTVFTVRTDYWSSCEKHLWGNMWLLFI